jgi:hypothetical protein
LGKWRSQPQAAIAGLCRLVLEASALFALAAVVVAQVMMVRLKWVVEEVVFLIKIISL